LPPGNAAEMIEAAEAQKTFVPDRRIYFTLRAALWDSAPPYS